MDSSGAPANGAQGLSATERVSESMRARYDQQRFKHLVLGKPRPKTTNTNRRKGLKAVRVRLEPGIEEQVALREDNPGAGTPETLAKFSEGSLQRLLLSGDISAEQKAYAESIADVAERIASGVQVRTCSFEARVDRKRNGDEAFFERLGDVRREMAYTEWRRQTSKVLAPLHEMIVEDQGLTIVARRYRMDNRRLKRVLADALDLWPKILGRVCKEVDAATLAAAHAGILG